MRQTRLALPEETRSAASAILQKRLINLLDLRLCVKQAHWTVRGPRFQQLHELFDGFVDPLDEEVDTLAERIATLGGVPDGRSQSIASDTVLEAYPARDIEGEEQLELLADRFAKIGEQVRVGIDEADALNDADTADILTGTSRFLDKSLWFIEAHLERV